MNSSSRLFYTSPAQSFHEALPMGNGSLGAVAYSGTQSDRYSLNLDTLWSGFPGNKRPDPKAYEAYRKTKNYTMDGEYRKAYLSAAGFLGNRSEVYLPLGNLFIHTSHSDICSYVRALDLENALLESSYLCCGVTYTKNAFLSYPDRVFVLRFSCDKKGALSFHASFDSQLKSCVFTDGNDLVMQGECPYRSYDTPENKCGYALEYSQEPDKKGVKFYARLRIMTDGVLHADPKTLSVTGASEAIFLLAADTNFLSPFALDDTDAFRAKVLTTLSLAAAKGFQTLKDAHTADYHALFDRTRLTFSGPSRDTLPTDERLAAFQEDPADAGLYALLFDYGKYLAISSSRQGTQASNLQGLWNECLTPPWRSNYTLNINTEMNYYPLLACGLFDCFEPLVRFVKDRSVTGKEAARVLYHADGFVLHHNSDIWGFALPASTAAEWGFWNAAGAWLCRELYRYYRYTGNVEYLEADAYPLMKQAALFYLDELCDNGECLSVCPTTSPENAFFDENGEKCAVARASAMTDSLVYGLFCDILDAGTHTAKCDRALEARIRAALPRMKPFTIGADGKIVEWDEPHTPVELHHRHVSHLYALFPGGLIDVKNDPQTAKACKASLVERGGDGTGWSLAWKLCLWASLGEKEEASRLLKRFLTPVETDTVCCTGGVYKNLLCAHPPFQIDGNFGVIAGLLNMLVSEDGTLLPALPNELCSGKLIGYRLKDGKILDFEWKDGRVVWQKLRTANDEK